MRIKAADGFEITALKQFFISLSVWLYDMLPTPSPCLTHSLSLSFILSSSIIFVHSVEIDYERNAQNYCLSSRAIYGKINEFFLPSYQEKNQCQMLLCYLPLN